jgi:hypothetical protein
VDYSNGGDFWDGTKILDHAVDALPNETVVGKYNEVVRWNDEALKDNINEYFNIREGDIGLNKATTEVSKPYKYTNYGRYIKNDGSISDAYTVMHPLGRSDMHISISVLNDLAAGDVTGFKAIVGHELNHVYHNHYISATNPFAVKIRHIYTERAAYRYTYNTYMSAGRIADAFSAALTAQSLGYWGYYPAQYKIPSVYLFH